MGRKRDKKKGGEMSKGDFRMLRGWEIQILKDRAAIDLHDGKLKIGGSRQDLYVDKKTGDVYTCRKGGWTEMQETGINIRDFFNRS